MNRRRFLAITAAALALPGAAHAETIWQGTALGAEATVTLTGPRDRAEAALASLPALLNAIEDEFSLYRPASTLSRLNAGNPVPPSPAFAGLLTQCDLLHEATEGAFDPSVQPLWRTLATGTATQIAIGWQHIPRGIPLRLLPGQALTFNGIAQGHATDAVAAHLSAHGFTQALIDIGELAALGGPFRIGLMDPDAGLTGTATLTSRAIATSSPRATLVAGQPHILHPRGLPPLWSSVTVEAVTATLADALSTALVFHDAPMIARIRTRLPGTHRIWVTDNRGNLTQI